MEDLFVCKAMSVLQLDFTAAGVPVTVGTGALEGIGALPKLRRLTLAGTRMKELPTEIRGCRQLRELNLRRSECLEELPHQLDLDLTQMEVLDVTGCFQLKVLPRAIFTDLWHCEGIEDTAYYGTQPGSDDDPFELDEVGERYSPDPDAPSKSEAPQPGRPHQHRNDKPDSSPKVSAGLTAQHKEQDDAENKDAPDACAVPSQQDNVDENNAVDKVANGVAVDKQLEDADHGEQEAIVANPQPVPPDPPEARDKGEGEPEQTCAGPDAKPETEEPVRESQLEEDQESGRMSIDAPREDDAMSDEAKPDDQAEEGKADSETADGKTDVEAENAKADVEPEDIKADVEVENDNVDDIEEDPGLTGKVFPDPFETNDMKDGEDGLVTWDVEATGISSQAHGDEENELQIDEAKASEEDAASSQENKEEYTHEAEPPESEDEQEFRVHEIVGHRKRHGKLYFHVMWEGFTEEHATWEPREHFEDDEGNTTVALLEYIAKNNLDEEEEKRRKRRRGR